jgi:hypothetical protein
VPKPLWRRAFDSAEQAVAPHLERAVQSTGFAGTFVLVQGTRKRVFRRLERDSRRAWHLLNLPAATDVRRLRRQVASLDREVRLLREAVENSDDREGPEGGKRNGAAGAGGRAGAGATGRRAQRAPGAQRHPDGDRNG